MVDSAGVHGLRACDNALRPEAQLIAARFRGVSQAEAELRLREQFSRLVAHATVQSHLGMVARAAVVSALRAEGFSFATPGVAGVAA